MDIWKLDKRSYQLGYKRHKIIQNYTAKEKSENKSKTFKQSENVRQNKQKNVKIIAKSI